jgi:tetratricopeptide (TPR) repeat protein
VITENIRRASRRVLFLGAVLTCAAVVAACGSPSEAQIANDFVKKGLAAHKKGAAAEATRDYREALVHDQYNKFAYYNLGLIAQTAGHLRIAELNYELALATDPKFTPALFNLGTVLSRTNPSDAVRVYQQLVALQPNNAGAHLNLGFALRSIGRKSDATKEFDRAVALNPSLRSRIENLR